MEFLLFYRGPLRANAGPIDKQAIRRSFHAQLKDLWQQRPLMSHRDQLLTPARSADDWTSLRVMAPFTFAPLVTEQTRMIAELHVTLLRPEEPGALITQGGDIDNRLKTLFDALRMPKAVNELSRNDKPNLDEVPFFCLLEDDNLITGVNVQTERLLGGQTSPNEVILVVRVRTRLTEVVVGNIGLV